MEAGGGDSEVGGNSARWLETKVGSNSDGFSTSKNHSSRNDYKSPKQFELKLSLRALRATKFR